MNGNNAKFSAVYNNQRYCPLCGRPWYSPEKSRTAGRQGTAAGQRTAVPGAAAGSSAGPAPMAGGMQSAPMTGMQTGGAAMSPAAQAAPTAPITDATQPAPMTMQGTEYLNGFLRTQIGKQVLVQFLLGSNTFVDKSGRLLDVGANYILLQLANSDDLLVCDFFNIRFVTVYQ
mgnify:CR=1 FL=1